MDLFEQADEKRQRINQITDEINGQYGEFCLQPARLLDRSSMPNVIAPAWRPHSHRNTV